VIRELFAKVRAKAQQQAQDSFAVYWQGVIRPLAEGREVDAEAIVQAAEAVNRGPDEVEADVELYRRRERMVAEYKQLPSVQKEIQQLETSIGKWNTELLEIQQRLGSQIATAIERRNLLSSQAGWASQTPSELIANCPCPALAARAAELNSQRKELQGQRGRLAGTERAAELDEQLRLLEKEADSIRQQQLNF
jgi:hypothetical protein